MSNYKPFYWDIETILRGAAKIWNKYLKIS